MQIAQENATTDLAVSVNVPESATAPAAHSEYKVIRRNGAVVGFEPSKIAVAMTKAFLAVNGSQGAASARIRELVAGLTDGVVGALMRRQPQGGTFHIEDIQDQVELALMRSGEHDVARAYVLYREGRAKARSQEKAARDAQQPAEAALHVVEGGQRRLLDRAALERVVAGACAGLEGSATPDAILEATLRDLYDGVPMDEVRKSAIMAARALIEKDPAYSYVTARLLLNTIRLEVIGEEVSQADMGARYAEYFPQFIERGIAAELLDPELAKFDLERLGKALSAERDLRFGYLGLQTLYDRYFLHVHNRRIELPQAFFMRVAMGLALNEGEREERAIEFYNVLSTFDFMSSTPTLFNSGTLRSQLSSCYLTTVADDLEGIYDAIKENALLAKFAGGLGNDWTPVRALGSHIKGTNGKSQGVVPFLKVVNDTAVAVNQGGKRKGAVCSYLETWHLDVEEFLELRKNTGDDRRRTHDMNTANWIPDLFMKRVLENAEWTLFSPCDVPELHDAFGKAFEEAYLRYEDRAARGDLKLYKKIPAVQLWRKMLSMLFETGHPWITFKDPCNLRSPQQHVGVVHSSNLCTEITLNTSGDEIAVCNLGSVNLVAHLAENGLDFDKLQRTIRTAMRMLDNVIDINYYAVDKARNSNLRHRPVGLGIMGFQDCLHRLRIAYASPEAVEFADRSMEMVAYCAYLASTELAEERGRYGSFEGSLWDSGVLPQDTLDILAAERGGYVEVDRSATLDWDALRPAHQAARHAQLELPRHRADRDHRQHRRRFGLDRAHLPEPVREIQPVGGVHGGERVPGVRPEEGRPVGRGHDRRSQVLRRQPGAHRPRAGRAAQAVRDRLRDRAQMAGRGRGAAAEVDRPVAVAQHLYGGRLGAQARRDLQAGLDPGPQDHLLPAGDGRHPRREIDRQDGSAERRAERRRHGGGGGARPSRRSARSTIRSARRANKKSR